MPLRQQKYKKHILEFLQKHAYANKKAKNMRPAAINKDKIISIHLIILSITRTASASDSPS